MEGSMLAKAIAYVERGWKVFPLHTARNFACSCGNQNCSSVAKHPRIKDWQVVCSADANQIKEWWGKWPDANIGLATGNASGCFVVDIDPRHGGKESLQQLIKQYGMLPKTLASNTGGGGYHLFFKTPSIKITNRANVLPGIDVRGEGGYVVAPPSIHQSGVMYSWINDFREAAILDAPEWLLQLLIQSTKPYTHSHMNMAAAISEGGRNNYLTREAGKLRRSGLEQNQLLAEVKKINHARCQPPLNDNEVFSICNSVAKYPSGSHSAVPLTDWPKEPTSLATTITKAPSLSENLLPECFKPWIIDASERMQVTPEFVMAPALVSFSSVVGRKLGIFPKEHDDWRVLPNLWGMIVARPGYFKSPTIAEALKPLERLCEAAHKENEANQHKAKTDHMFANMQLEALRDMVKKAQKQGDYEKLEELKIQVGELEKTTATSLFVERRYKTNDATIEKLARLLNENPNGLLLLRDELNGWLQLLSKTGREGDKEFFLESWNGYGSYSIDRVGSGTLRVPALCLSIFGGMQPGKLHTFVERTLQGSAEDDGLLQRFQILIYPELSPDWDNIDRIPNFTAQENVGNFFQKIAQVELNREENASVKFCPAAQELFNNWRRDLERRIRSDQVVCPAFESHLSKYRSLMPSLALLFWVLENPENIYGRGAVSLPAATLAIEWCSFLEQHALKAYAVGQNAQSIAAKRLADCIEKGLLRDGTPVRSLYRKQWSQLRTPQLVDQALETLEELKWLRIVYATVQGGRTKTIELHPKFRRLQKGEHHHGNEITTNYNGNSQDHSDADRTALLGGDNHKI